MKPTDPTTHAATGTARPSSASHRAAPASACTGRLGSLAAALALAMAGSLAPSPPAQAQSGHVAHGHHDAKAAADRGPSDFVDVEVRRIDRDRQRVTLRHGEVKELEMPPMTMVFRLAEPALLNSLSDGAKVQVRMAIRGGNYFVTEVRPAP